MARSKLFDPDSATPFALSRSKVDLFLQCPRCFYLDRHLSIMTQVKARMCQRCRPACGVRR